MAAARAKGGSLSLAVQALSVSRGGCELAGESVGEGPPIVFVHGLTATRRYVVHGSKLLARQGWRLISYDARGHGCSSPAPPGEYGYTELAADLEAVIAAETAGRAVVAGHSMGAHTAVAHALAHPASVAALVLVCPAYPGVPLGEVHLREWDALAGALERDGIDGFAALQEKRVPPAWREVVGRVTRQRLAEHASLAAVAQALREVPRSAPFEGLAELELVEAPALVVASGDEADPGHPRSVAEEYARRLPHAELAMEGEGESPLAWRGAALSGAIAEFLAGPGVRSRLGL